MFYPIIFLNVYDNYDRLIYIYILYIIYYILYIRKLGYKFHKNCFNILLTLYSISMMTEEKSVEYT